MPFKSVCDKKRKKVTIRGGGVDMDGWIDFGKSAVYVVLCCVKIGYSDGVVWMCYNRMCECCVKSSSK